MNKIHRYKWGFILFYSMVALSGCNPSAEVEIPPLTDEPQLVSITPKDLADHIPAYGVAISETGKKTTIFEVNIEAEDAHLVKIGQNATVLVIPQKFPLAAKVIKLVKGASTETGQAIAWIKLSNKGQMVPVGEFIFASITTQIKKQVLTVPAKAIMIRDGKVIVIRLETHDGKKLFTPVEIKTGIQSGDDLQVISGLKKDDQVVIQGGIGFLYPDFKSAGDD